MPLPQGRCHLCGQDMVLTYEHVPAQTAYNQAPVTMYGLESWLARRDDGEMVGGDLLERGGGAHTLCNDCNSGITGGQYVPELKKWVQAGAGILQQIFKDPEAAGNAVECVFKGVYPALFLKQMVAMLASINSASLMDDHPALRKFVLERSATGLPKRYRFYLAFTHPKSTIARYAGLSARLVEGQWCATWVTDLVWPPFVYIMTIDEPTPFLPLGDITSFANRRHNERVDQRLSLLIPVTEQPYPGELSDPMGVPVHSAALPTAYSMRLPITVTFASGEVRSGGELTHPVALAEWNGSVLREVLVRLCQIAETVRISPVI